MFRFIYFYHNYLYFVINCLNTNCVTIYRANYLGRMTLKNLPAICKSLENSNPKNEGKQNYYNFFCASSIIKSLQHFEKMTVFKNLLMQLSRKGYSIISVFHKTFLPSYCSMVWWWSQMMSRLLANVSNNYKLAVTHFNLAYLFHIWNIWNIHIHKKR